MHTVGIIAEYNPFHNGHAQMIREIRRRIPDAAILAIMSGSFTQRGEPALPDKWQRAQTAVLCGCDLVLELPFAFAVRSAQDFARGAVLLMERLGIVRTIAFGSECWHLPTLQGMASLMDSPCLQESVHNAVRRGKSYAAALTCAMASHPGIEETSLRQPNTILALEYLRSLRLTKSAIEPLPIKRRGSGHHDMTLQGSIASASAIRRELMRTAPDWNALRAVLPTHSLHYLQGCSSFLGTEPLFRPALAKLYTARLEELRKIHGIGEGLEQRLLASAKTAQTMQELVASAASKRHPQSRIRRTLAHLLTGFTKKQAAEFDREGPLYARILSFNNAGKSLLQEVKKEGQIPLVSKTSRLLTGKDMHRPTEALTSLQNMLRCDCLASDLQGLCCSPPLRGGRDFLTSPGYVRERQRQ